MSNVRRHKGDSVVVEHIYTSPAPGSAQVEQVSIEFVAGSGIPGDRYFGRHDEPGQNVTLIEAEEIEAFLEALSLPHDLSVTNRNLITRGVRLNELVGREFTVGGVRMLGVELCEPCLGLGAMLASEAASPAVVVKLLVHRAGLRADVLSSGVVSRGAAVQSAA
jgi:MOSC domain-containing protein YiiM